MGAQHNTISLENSCQQSRPNVLKRREVETLISPQEATETVAETLSRYERNNVLAVQQLI